jgi:hypothetical protein
LEQHLGALQGQLQLAVQMQEFAIAVELEENVRVVQVQGIIGSGRRRETTLWLTMLFVNANPL